MHGLRGRFEFTKDDYNVALLERQTVSFEHYITFLVNKYHNHTLK